MSRGGAGNIYAAQQANDRVSADLEANRSRADPQALPAPVREEPEYAHHGRGGLGNWHSPREMSETGVYQDSDMVPMVGDGVNTLGSGPVDKSSRNLPDRIAEPPRFAGRGGSGNYVWDSAQTQEKTVQKTTAEEEEQRKEQLRVQVEQGVKDTLAMPPRAKVSGAQQYD